MIAGSAGCRSAGSIVVFCCRPSGAWRNSSSLTRGRRSFVALTPGYMLSPLRGSQSHRTDQGTFNHPFLKAPGGGDSNPPRNRSGSPRFSRSSWADCRKHRGVLGAGQFALTGAKTSQSHRTDQGSSKASSRSVGETPRIRSRNPTVQIREVPRRYTEQTPLAPLFAVAIPPYRSGKFQGGGQDRLPVRKPRRRNPTVQIREVPSRPRPAFRRPRLQSRNPTVQIREVPRESRMAPTVPASSRRNPTVQIREVPSFSRHIWRDSRKKVAIPPYRSGKFQENYLTIPPDALEKSQSHRTDQGSSKSDRSNLLSLQALKLGLFTTHPLGRLRFSFSTALQPNASRATS